MKYILVTGGVISGIGKGVIASSIGTILRCHGLKVTSIKIDPYINIDAGTFSPYEHGEVFVLDDGGEVDLDLGNYERFLDVTLKSDNNITTGKIYLDVITKERKGEYLGKTVQVVPHITDAIQNWVERVARVPVDETNSSPEVCIIELGGTIGDIESMPFVEAFNQLQFKVKQENFCVVHVSLIPQLSSGQQKTKPTQHSVREMRGLGLIPDFIVARCVDNLPHSIVNKISNFCNIPLKQILVLPDISNTYQVPLIIEDQNFTHLLFTRLGISHQDYPLNLRFYNKWKNMTKKYENNMDKVKIVLVGKYTQFDDSYTSVIRALQHASITAGYSVQVEFVESLKLEPSYKASNLLEYQKAWETLKSSQGILVPGGFGERGIDGKILAIEWARTNGKPFLGICLGMQLALVEMARNLLGLSKATSAEFLQQFDSLNNGAAIIIKEMPEFNPDSKGGTMRLGKRRTLFKSSPKRLVDNSAGAMPYQSIVRKLYGNLDRVDERHRHRFEFNTDYKSDLEKVGVHFVGEDEKGERMEIIELEGHPFFVGTQFHPEYKTRPLKPSPVYYGFVLASIGILDTVLSSDRTTLVKTPLANGHESFIEGMQGLNLMAENSSTATTTSASKPQEMQNVSNQAKTPEKLGIDLKATTSTTNGYAYNFELHPEVVFSQSGMFSPEKLNTHNLGATTFAN